MPKFYITTPLYYVNDVPHIGHSYTTIACDVLARYKRLKGFDVYFLTGTDEHGQKVFKAAEKENKSPKEFVDSVSTRFVSAWEKLNISYTDFIRTTEDRHQKVVQNVFSELLKKGFVYKGDYEGWYCVPCETFWAENQMVQDLEGRFLCPDCGRAVEKIKEESYFLKLSAFGDRLLDYYAKNPDFIKPESRKNEIVNFVKEGLKDLSITRTAFPWGVPVPGDLKHVVYVWFDALLNYISALGYPNDPLFKKYWPADVHVMGKEIVRFHAVIWPAMLMALEVDLPRKVFGHGWWTVDGKKMSKTTGNVVDPILMSEKYGVDTFRYFILKEVPFGSDGDFSESSLVSKYNSDLANDLGNLLSRTLTMIEKYFEGVIPEVPNYEIDDLSVEISSKLKKLPEKVDLAMENLQFSQALDHIWEIISFANFYIEKEAPWALAKNKEEEKLKVVLYNLYETLSCISEFVAPFMPETSKNIKIQLNSPRKDGFSSPPYGIKIAGTKINKGNPLFPRLQK